MYIYMYICEEVSAYLDHVGVMNLDLPSHSDVTGKLDRE